METLQTTNRQKFIDEFGIDPLVEPWDHQFKGVLLSRPHNGFLFLYAPGVGKTFTSVMASRVKMAQDHAQLKVLVVCPLIVVNNWVLEWRRFSKVNHSKIIALSGTGKEREKTVKQGAQVFIASYESMIMPGVHKALSAWKPDIMIIDEVHWCRNPVAKRTKAVHAMSKLAKYRFGLSGTPVLNSPMDLFGQFLVVDLGKTFGDNFFVFRGQYFYDAMANSPSLKKFPLWKIRSGSEKQIQDKISTISMTAKKEECLSLPPLVHKNIYFDLEGDQLKAYNQLEKDFIAYCDDKACQAPMALTKALRLMQVSSGFIPLEDIDGGKHVKKFTDHPRRKALKEILPEIAPYHKVIIWSIFLQNYADIKSVADDLGFKWVELSGEVSSKEKLRSMDTFKNDNDCRILIGHPLSAGIGANFQHSSYSIVYSRNMSLEQELQSTARSHRGGSEIHEKITRINLIAKNTVDEVIAERLASKKDMSDKLIFDIAKDLKELRHGRPIRDR